MRKIGLKPARYLRQWILGIGLLAASGISAQSIGPSVINSAGGSSTIAGNTYEWSVGETVVTTYTSSTLIVTQGLLQPENALPSSVQEETSIPDSKFLVYPNPVEDQLSLRPDFKPGDELSYVLYDVTGRQLASLDQKLATGKEVQTLNVASLAVGEYILQVQIKTADQVLTSGYRIQKK